MTPEVREMRFDLEKWLPEWLRVHEFAADWVLAHGITMRPGELVSLVSDIRTAAEAALLTPSPCPKGCRMCDWVEPENLCDMNIAISVSDGAPAAASPAIWERPVVRTFNVGHCRRCAELEHVRQQERAKALEQVRAAVLSPTVCFHPDELNRILELIPAEAQGGPKGDEFRQALAVRDAEIAKLYRIQNATLALKFDFMDGEEYGCPICGWFEGHKPDCALMKMKVLLDRLIESRVSERTKELRERLRTNALNRHVIHHGGSASFETCTNGDCIEDRQLLARGGTEPRP